MPGRQSSDHLFISNFSKTAFPKLNQHVYIFKSSPKDMLIDFRGRGGEGGEKERETSISCLSHAPQPGPNTKPRHVP